MNNQYRELLVMLWPSSFYEMGNAVHEIIQQFSYQWVSDWRW